jgi:hypothetical protein
MRTDRTNGFSTGLVSTRNSGVQVPPSARALDSISAAACRLPSTGSYDFDVVPTKFAVVAWVKRTMQGCRESIRLLYRQSTPDQDDPDQLEPDQVDPDQVEPDQVDPDQVEPDQVDPDQVDPDHDDPDHDDPDQVEPDQEDPDQVPVTRRPAESKVWLVQAVLVSEALAHVLAAKALLYAWYSPVRRSLAEVPTWNVPRALSSVPVPDDAGNDWVVFGVGAPRAAARLIMPLPCCAIGMPRA